MTCIRSGRSRLIGQKGEATALLPSLRRAEWVLSAARHVSPTRPRFARPPSPETGRERKEHHVRRFPEKPLFPVRRSGQNRHHNRRVGGVWLARRESARRRRRQCCASGEQRG